MSAHPCPYPQVVLDLFDRLLQADALVLDPFAGIGRIHDLAVPTLFGTRRTIGVELEQEWANAHRDTIQGDATALPFPDDTFDAIATSPAYGNRMADRTVRPTADTNSYAHSLGRLLSPGSGASLQWDRGYQDLHRLAIAEMVRVVRPGGLILVNMKDHPRGFEHQHVTDWWITTLTDAGAVLIDRHTVNSGGIPHGANRTPMSEYVLVHEVT